MDEISRRNAFARAQFYRSGNQSGQEAESGCTPKPWSKPVNRVDNAAYRHDLAYARHSDAAERIVADKKMIKELEGITNPNVKERMETAVVKPILKTKVKFGV